MNTQKTLTSEDRALIGQLTSYTMEQLARNILRRLNMNQHFAPFLQIQAILSADPAVLKEEFEKFRIVGK